MPLRASPVFLYFGIMKTRVSSSCHFGSESIDLTSLSQTGAPQQSADGREHPEGPRSHPVVNSAHFPGAGGTALVSSDFSSPKRFDSSSAYGLSLLMCWVSVQDDLFFFLTEWIIFPSLDIYSNYHQVWCSQWPWLSITNTELGRERGMAGGYFFTVS